MKRPEQALQQSVAQFLDHALPEDAFWFAIPNAAKRGVVEAVNMKRAGLKKGLPDICIIFRGWAYGIEMKAGKGKLSKDQALVHQQLGRAGVHVQTCYSLAEVQLALKGWNIPLRAKVN